MISFRCPHCDKPLNVKDELAGKSGKCPSCKQTAQVPDKTAGGRTAKLKSHVATQTPLREEETLPPRTADVPARTAARAQVSRHRRSLRKCSSSSRSPSCPIPKGRPSGGADSP